MGGGAVGGEVGRRGSRVESEVSDGSCWRKVEIVVEELRLAVKVVERRK